MSKSPKPSLMQLRWFRTFIGTLAAFFAMMFVLPLLYELFSMFTPSVDRATEQRTRSAVLFITNMFAWAVLVLGLLLAWTQRNTYLRREYLHKRVVERRRERRQEARSQQYEKLYGKKRRGPVKPPVKPD